MTNRSSPAEEKLPFFRHTPWGSEQIWAHVPGKYCSKLLYVNAGKRMSLQYHEFKEETMLLKSGIVYLLLGEDLIRMEGGVPYHISPGVVHRLSAVTDTMVYETSTTELDDVVRLEDDYSR